MLGAVLCLASGSARAEVVVRAGVPFTALQLEAAVAARGGPAGLDIEVSSPWPERVALVTPGGRWVIEIGAARGEAAARVVALHVVELPADAAPVSAGVARAPGEVAPVAQARAAGPRVAALAVGAMGTHRTDFASLGGAIELSYTDAWILGAGLSWQHEQYDLLFGPQASGELLRGRVVAGVALGPAELVANGFVGRLEFDDRTNDVGYWTIGLGAEVRVLLPVSSEWAVVLATGAEQSAVLSDMWNIYAPIAEMPRTTVAAGIGVAWRGGHSK